MHTLHEGLQKMSLEEYIKLIDRLLEREKLGPDERDAIFNDEDNIELISLAHSNKVHPLQVLKKLDRRPVNQMYASAELNEYLLMLGLTPGQEYAVNFFEPMGYKFVSTKQQMKRGTLIFTKDEKTFWAIYRTGYLRKKVVDPNKVKHSWSGEDQFGVIYNGHAKGSGQPMDDEDYIELTHLLSQKMKRHDNKKPYRSTRVNSFYRELADKVEFKLKQARYDEKLTEIEIQETIKKLHKRYIK